MTVFRYAFAAGALFAVSLLSGCGDAEPTAQGSSAASSTTSPASSSTTSPSSVGPSSSTPSSSSTVAPPAPTTSASDPVEVPTLSDDEAVAVAEAFVDGITVAAETGDFANAEARWSGYPDRPENKLPALQQLVDQEPWFRSGQVRFDVSRAWSFQPEWAMAIVTVTDLDWAGTTALVIDGEGLIQRIGATDGGAWAAERIAYDQTMVSLESVPTEGGVRAFLDGAEIAEESISVDHRALRTTIILPPAGAEPEILTVSFATPELPSAHSFLLFRGGAT